ncbi:MAG: hypothetical protein PHV68_07935 [Candidatus Gastranaerophilales bacterium]|nr:hypothetical protein [Candidatus Gastranaerophilales bacterium]
MIETFIGLMFISDQNPAATNELYPSGIKEIDKYEHHKTIPTSYALVKSANPIGELPAGVYEVRISEDKKFVFLAQSGYIEKIVPVFSQIKLEKEYTIPVAEISNGELILKEKNYKYTVKF